MWVLVVQKSCICPKCEFEMVRCLSVAGRLPEVVACWLQCGGGVRRV